MIWIPLLFQQPKFLGLQVVLVLLLVLVHAIPESPLSVSVNIHLHDTLPQWHNGCLPKRSQNLRGTRKTPACRSRIPTSPASKWGTTKPVNYIDWKHELVHDRLLFVIAYEIIPTKLDSIVIPLDPEQQNIQTKSCVFWLSKFSPNNRTWKTHEQLKAKERYKKYWLVHSWCMIFFVGEKSTLIQSLSFRK